MNINTKKRLKKSLFAGAVAGIIYSLLMWTMDAVIRDVEHTYDYYVWCGAGFFAGMSVYYYYFLGKKKK